MILNDAETEDLHLKLTITHFTLGLGWKIGKLLINVPETWLKTWLKRDFKPEFSSKTTENPHFSISHVSSIQSIHFSTFRLPCTDS